ncbi:MAG: hypothetical protein WD960_03655 [Gemmatimonadota bacterium]
MILSRWTGLLDTGAFRFKPDAPRGPDLSGYSLDELRMVKQPRQLAHWRAGRLGAHEFNIFGISVRERRFPEVVGQLTAAERAELRLDGPENPAMLRYRAERRDRP